MPVGFSTTRVKLPNTLRAVLMLAVDTLKSISRSATAAKEEPDLEITKDLAILRVAKCTELKTSHLAIQPVVDLGLSWTICQIMLQRSHQEPQRDLVQQ
ncbi:hypothetical protein G9A89_004018 [Geosiphon pyriformis]|nr:hypothetical protein G9A89_004018 [Geosiphon pyriformis]